MENVYLVQPSNILSGEIFLPYAAGAIASYAWQFKEISSAYRLRKIIFKKEPFEDIISSMENPFFVGFSCYMWNIEYNIGLAERIKHKWPSCIIGLGGPEIPDDTVYLQKYPFLDLLLHGEGEITFYNVLTSLLNHKSVESVDNISYRDSDGIKQTTKTINSSVSEFPSAYASGVFDDIIKDPKNRGLKFDAILETNRGCPYSCIYCYWAGTKKNFRQFSIQKVKDDLDWMARNGIVYCICADSNFGIMERDVEITDYIVSLKKSMGFPQKFETSAAKEKSNQVFQINKKLDSVGLNCGISVAAQSFSPIVLKNISRHNMTIDMFKEQMELYRNAGMSTYTDFILGLPGETYESFCHGIFLALEAGQHKSINIHPCEVLPNTVLYLPEIRKKYGIQTMASKHFQEHTELETEALIGSRSEVIIATDTMTMDEWKQAMRLSICVQAFHSFGLLKYFAIYLRKACGVSYEKFYMQLFDWIEEESGFIKSLLDDVCNSIDLFLLGKGSLIYHNTDFANAFLSYKEGLFLCCVKSLTKFYDEICSYIKPLFNDEILFNDLVCFQCESIVTPMSVRSSIWFKYDWKEYFEHTFDKGFVNPTRKTTRLCTEACKTVGWYEYTRDYVWRGKRENKMIRLFEYEN